MQPVTVYRALLRCYPAAFRDEYERIFGKLVSFDQPHASVDFRYNVLDTPEVHRNAELYQVLEVQAVGEVRVDRGDISVVCGFGPARVPLDGRVLLASESVTIAER